MTRDTADILERPIIVVLGGTGVIGTALKNVALRREFEVISVSLDPEATSDGYRNSQIDLHALRPGALGAHLSNIVPENRTIFAIYDIVGLSPDHIGELANFAAARGITIGQISSCLLYDHDRSGPVDEDCPLLDPDKPMFPYQALKQAQESALSARQDINWRIFRTHHVIGRGGLLGCIPDQNRDPELLAQLRSGTPLRLAQEGQLRLSFIHAVDLATAMIDLCDDPSTVRQAINVVHPDVALARDYYFILSDLMGLPKPKIAPFNVPSSDFWSLTAKDNVFFSNHPAAGKLNFQHDLVSSLTDALAVGESCYPSLGKYMGRRISGSNRKH